MSKDRQLISVIFPFYNAEQFLEVSIKSILNQTYKNFELILINDGLLRLKSDFKSIV